MIIQTLNTYKKQLLKCSDFIIDLIEHPNKRNSKKYNSSITGISVLDSNFIYKMHVHLRHNEYIIPVYQSISNTYLPVSNKIECDISKLDKSYFFNLSIIEPNYDPYMAFIDLLNTRLVVLYKNKYVSIIIDYEKFFKYFRITLNAY